MLAPAARAERAGVVLVCGGCFWSGWGLQAGQTGATWGMAYLADNEVKEEKGKRDESVNTQITKTSLGDLPVTRSIT